MCSHAEDMQICRQARAAYTRPRSLFHRRPGELETPPQAPARLVIPAGAPGDGSGAGRAVQAGVRLRHCPMARPGREWASHQLLSVLLLVLVFVSPSRLFSSALSCLLLLLEPP